jgi:hypothetical protein
LQEIPRAVAGDFHDAAVRQKSSLHGAHSFMAACVGRCAKPRKVYLRARLCSETV